tara:strand:+ start:291 stop:1031 length:741 start_codon:yes stop_codon:yes gene_type:complete
MDIKTIKGVNHYLYDNINEFKALTGLSAVVDDWRQAKEGNWTYTDDGYICQILKRFTVKGLGTRNPLCVRTVCGTFVVTGKKKMLGEDGVAQNIFTFSGETPKNLSENKQMLFARYMASGLSPIESYKAACPNAESEKYIKLQTSKLLKTKEVQKMIKKEVVATLEKQGVTPDWIVERYKTIADLAEKDSDKLRSLESLSKISGLFETEDKKSEQLTVFAGFSPKQLEEVKNGKARLLAHGEKEEK